MVAILSMSAKSVILGLPKIIVFWNKKYDVLTSVFNEAKQSLSYDSNFIVDVVMWPKFVNSRISIGEIIYLTFITIWLEMGFFYGCFGSSSIFRIISKWSLEILHHYKIKVKTKSQRLREGRRINSYVVEVGKIVWGSFQAPYSLSPSSIGIRC